MMIHVNLLVRNLLMMKILKVITMILAAASLSVCGGSLEQVASVSDAQNYKITPTAFSRR